MLTFPVVAVGFYVVVITTVSVSVGSTIAFSVSTASFLSSMASDVSVSLFAVPQATIKKLKLMIIVNL